MKLLKIEGSQGQFIGIDGEYLTVDKITKEDLLRMVELVLARDVEFDEYDSEALRNQAHQIIYQSVHGKLKELSERRAEFLDESERLYLEEYEKYKPSTSSREGESDAEGDDG
jgi:hypothetical protein